MMRLKNDETQAKVGSSSVPFFCLSYYISGNPCVFLYCYFICLVSFLFLCLFHYCRVLFFLISVFLWHAWRHSVVIPTILLSLATEGESFFWSCTGALHTVLTERPPIFSPLPHTLKLAASFLLHHHRKISDSSPDCKSLGDVYAAKKGQITKKVDGKNSILAFLNSSTRRFSSPSPKWGMPKPRSRERIVT